MSKMSFEDVAKPIVKQPTVPFSEGFPISSIYRFLKDHPKLKHTKDVYGNIFVKYDGTTSSKFPRTILTAHLDHPGFRWIEDIDSKTSLFGIYGGINKNLLINQPVRVYNPLSENSRRSIRGTINKVHNFNNSRSNVEVSFPLKTNKKHLKNSFCCLDITPWRLYGDRLHARACDDLVGVGVALTTIAKLALSNEPIKAGILLTRAEEVGFAGILGTLNENYLSKKDIYVNIECSSIRAGAILGEGPIIRVGDRITVFDPDVSSALTYCADNIQQKNRTFSFQRKLMDGGACEATPLVRAGFQTGAVAIPLDNYHNDGGTKLKAEIVDLRDVNNLIVLLTTFCLSQSNKESFTSVANQSIDRKMEDTFTRYRQDLKKLPISPK
ncbi:MAG: hypothetical protein VX294_10180 [Candidatus Latescibacterota bacterium]|nr:hypothetical protein [Candidatus Latescibacterota bacterium]